MATVNELLSKAAGSALKSGVMTNLEKQPNAATVAQPLTPATPVYNQAPTVTPEQAMQIAASRGAGGAGLDSASPEEIALRTNTPLQNLGSYGDTGMVAPTQALQRGVDAYGNAVNSQRDASREITDSAIGVTQGFVGTIGGLGELAGGVLSPQLGAMIHKGNKAVDSTLGSWLSDPMQQHQEASQARMFNYNRDSALKFEQDKKEHGEFVAGAMRIGRDAINSLSDTNSDGMLVGQGTANAVGSLFATGPVGKLLGGGARLFGASEAVIAKLAVAAEAEAKAGSFGSARALSWLAENAPATLSNSLLEAGGAYQGAVDTILNTDPALLAKNSQAYRDLKAQGMDDQQAKEELARKAGMFAGSLAGVLSLPTSAMVAGLEKAPLNRAFGHAGADVLIKEPTEEAVQGIAGQYAQNLAQKTYGDQNQDMYSGLGEQLSQGAQFGALAAGTAHGAGVAKRAGETAAALTKSAAPKVSKAITTTVEAVANAGNAVKEQTAKNQATTGVSPEALKTRANEVVKQAEKVQPAEEGATPDKFEQATQAVSTFLKGDQSVIENAPEEVKTAVTGSKNVVEAMDNLASIIEHPETTADTKMHAAQALTHYIDQAKDVFTTHGSTIDEMPEGHAAQKVMNASMELLSDLQGSTPVRNAVKTARAAMAAQLASGTKVTADNISTPEGQAQAVAVAMQARLDPSAVDPEQAAVVKSAASAGQIQLGDKESAALGAAVGISQAAKAFDDRMIKNAGGDRSKLPKVENVGIDVRSGNDVKKKSGVTHVNDVIRAMSSNNIDEAKKLMGDMGRFLKSQSNKIAALNKSTETGVGEHYVTYAPGSIKPVDSAEPVQLHLNNEGSVKFGNKVDAETKYIADLHNTLVDAYPQLGLKKMNVPDIRTSSPAVAPKVQVKKTQPKVEKSIITDTIKANIEKMKPEQRQKLIDNLSKFEKDGSIKEDGQAKLDYARSLQKDVAPEVKEEPKQEEVAPTPEPTSEPEPVPMTPRQRLRKTINMPWGEGALAQRNERMQNHADAITDLLGLPKVQVVVSPVVRDSNGNIVGGLYDPATRTISINDSIMKKSGKAGGLAAIEVLHHELGHYFHEMAVTNVLGADAWSTQGWDKEAIRKIRPEVVEAYEQYLKDNNLTGAQEETAPNAEVSPSPITMATDTRLFQGQVTFHEWFADHVARAVSNELVERGAIGTFFQKIGEELTRIYNMLKGTPELNSWLADKSVADWVRESMDTQHSPMVEPVTEESHTLGSSGSVSERFDTLVSDHLAEGMISNAANTRLAAESNPISKLDQLLADPDAMKAYLGGKDLGLTAEQRSQFRHLLSFAPAILDTINASLNSKAVKDKEENAAKRGADLFAYREARILNVAEKMQDGSYRLHPQIGEMAVLAAMHQLIADSGLKRFSLDATDADRLARTLGVPKLTPEAVSFLSLGTTPRFLAESNAKHLARFLGLQANPDAPAAYSEGILQSLMSDVADAMVQQGLLKKESFRINDYNGKPKNFSALISAERLERVKEVRAGQDVDYSETVTSKQDLLAIVAMKDRESSTNYFAGEKMPKSRGQLHNTGVALTAEQEKALAFERKVPFKINTPMVLLNQFLGGEGLVHLFGDSSVAQRIKDGTINKAHAESLTSTNSGILRSFEAMKNAYAAAKLRAAENGEAIHEIEHFYDYAFTKANRMQMLGDNNPQADKVMREVMMSTESTIDLSKKSNQDYKSFILAVAQAAGIKVHQKMYSTVRDELMEKMNHEAMAPVKALMTNIAKTADRIESGAVDLGAFGKSMTPAQVDTIKKAFESAKIDMTPVALYAVHEFYRGTQSKSKEFKTKLYFEADGVTNGVINTIMFTATQVSEHFFEAMRRGGLYVGKKSTLNEYMSQPGSVDTYMATARNLVDAYADVQKTMPREFKQGNEYGRYLLDIFGGDISFNEDGSMNVKRNGVKKPVTAANYGAGDTAVSNGMTSTIIGSMQESISEALLANPNVSLAEALFGTDPDHQRFGMQALKYMTSNKAVVNSKGAKIFSGYGFTGDMKAADFDLRPNEFENMSSWFQHTYVNAFREGMNRTLGLDVVDNMDSLKTLTGIGSLLLGPIYRLEMDRAIEAKKAADPEWNESLGLSKNELKALEDKMRAMLPPVEHDGVRVDLLGGEKSTGTKPIAEGLSGTQTYQNIFIPSPIGVGGLPLLIQAAGDANMMLKSSNSNNPDAPQQYSLKTFDGQQSAVGHAMGLASEANHSVEQTWQNNIYRDLVPVLKTLSTALDSDPEYAKAVTEEINKNEDYAKQFERMFGKEFDHPFNYMFDIVSTAERLADAHDKVLSGLNKYKWSVDQMAGMGNPYIKEGAATRKSDATLAKELGATSTPPVPSVASVGTYGDDDRLQKLGQQWDKMINNYVADTGRMSPERAVRVDEVEAAQEFALKGLKHLQDFGLNHQQTLAATSMLTAFATQMKLDPVALQEAQKLYLHVLDNTDNLSFTNGRYDQATLEDSAKKLQILQGLNSYEDEMGRGSSLPLFMALVTASEPLREHIRNIPTPEGQKSDQAGINGTLENAGFALMEKLSSLYTTAGKEPNVLRALDTLHEHLLDEREKSDNLLSLGLDKITGSVNYLNNVVVDGMSRAGEALGRSADLQDTSTGYGKTLYNLKTIAASFLNDDRAEGAVESIASRFNASNMPNILRHVFIDLIGRTSSNAGVYDLQKLVHAEAAQTRAIAVDGTISAIKDSFSRKLEDHENTAMHTAFAKTDIQALKDLVPVSELPALLNDRMKRGDLKQAVIDKIKSLASGDATLILHNADNLAHFMMTGEHPSMLLKNAEAIAANLGTKVNESAPKVDAELVKAIDQYVSLKALDQVDSGTLNVLSDLAENESAGMAFVIAQAAGNAASEAEADKKNPLTRFNRVKGFIHPQNEVGNTLVVADANKGAELLGQGFQQVGEYKGSSADRGRGRHHYYYLSMNANSAFGSGIMQTIRPTAGGVDQSTGFRTHGTAGVITETTNVNRITRLLGQEKGNELLAPVFDHNGNIYAYERTVDPSMVKEYLKPQSNIVEAVALQKGRIIEELKAGVLNQTLVDEAHKMWQEDQKRVTYDPNQYINLYETKDPIYADAMKLVPPATRHYIEQVFGKDTFMVRKDLVAMAIGERSASTADLWTGVTRWTPDQVEALKGIAVTVFGNKAYIRLRQGEQVVENAVARAKDWIVTKSIVVPWANLISNMLAQMERGIPLRKQIPALGRKVLEIRAYTKGREKEVILQAKLNAETNPGRQFRLRKEIEQITDGYKRLSIWPLIQAGEFSAISDTEAYEAEKDAIQMMLKGNLQDVMEHAVDRLPESAKAAGRNFLLTSDSPLGRALEMTTQYGDFLAKAVYYDHLVENGASAKEAMAKITEEYVNYDIPAGRWRGKLEKVGLAWFLNYPLRTTKVALNVVRKNPVHALLAQFINPLGLLSSSVGSPLSDSLPAKLLTGRITNNFGPSMGFHAASLTPAGRVIGAAF